MVLGCKGCTFKKERKKRGQPPLVCRFDNQINGCPFFAQVLQNEIGFANVFGNAGIKKNIHSGLEGSKDAAELVSALIDKGVSGKDAPFGQIWLIFQDV